MDPSEPEPVPSDPGADAGDVARPSAAPVPASPAARASDADRERASSTVQAAGADGRLSFEELDERLTLVHRATSTADLAAIVDDLQPSRFVTGRPTATKDVGIINGLTRGGRWIVGDTYRATAVISTGVIDLREARFTSPDTTIGIRSWIGTVYVIVPADAEVHVGGSGVLGGFTNDLTGTVAGPTAPRITVEGLAVCGTVSVVHELPPAVRRRLERRERRTSGPRRAIAPGDRP